MKSAAAIVCTLLFACGDNTASPSYDAAPIGPDAELRCYKYDTYECFDDGTYWLDSCDEPHQQIATCESTARCYRGHCCDELVQGGSFALPAHANYVHWSAPPQGYAEIRYELEIDNMPGEELGMYWAHNGSIDETRFYFGLQTTMAKPGEGRVGRGVIFSRWGTRDLADTRAAQGGYTESSGHEGDFVGVRALYPWHAGNYSLRLRRGEAEAAGDWFALSIEDHATGETTDLGAMRFPRSGSEPASFQGGGTLMTEVYSMPLDHQGGPDYGVVPRWQVGAMIFADDTKAEHANLAYPAFPNDQAYPNANGVYDRRKEKVVLDIGGDTMRCTPPGALY